MSEPETPQRCSPATHTERPRAKRPAAETVGQCRPDYRVDDKGATSRTRDRRNSHARTHSSKRNGITTLLNSSHARLGKLQRRVLRAFIALGIAATTRQIAVFCYPREMTRGERLPRWRIRNQARAAKSIGARPGERVGQQRVWRLK
jgi:hypothetical protein